MRSSGQGSFSALTQDTRSQRSVFIPFGDRTALDQRSRPFGSALLRAACVAIAAVATSIAFAATTTVSLLIDADNNAASGCSISTANGAFSGVDRVLNTVVVADPAGYRIASITQQSCIGGALGPAGVVDSTSTPLARGNGAGGATAVETYLPNSFLSATGQKMRIGVTTLGSDGLLGADALTLSGAGPILVDGPPLLVVPTTTKLSLALTALLLSLSVWYARRRGWQGMQLVVVAAFAISMSGQLIAAIVRDGFIGDWSGIAPVAIDPAGDAPVGADITNLYSTVDNGNVYFRIDTVLNAPPIANAQTVTSIVGQPLPITLTGSDFESSPLTFSVVTQPTQGALSGVAPNLTYTPNSGAAATDSFTFKANDGSLDSAPATVTIGTSRAPAITSGTSTTFAPTQTNSFTVIADGLPVPTTSIGTCAPVLPATITFTANVLGGGVIAGNPTAAQAGIYVCPITSANGILPNATQSFTITIASTPAFTSPASVDFAVATAKTFTIVSTGVPAATLSNPGGCTLPAGLTLDLVGKTVAGTATATGTATCNLVATNTAGTANQALVVNVLQAPVFTASGPYNLTAGNTTSFSATASGVPLPTITQTSGTLPAGITVVSNPAGTINFGGTPTAIGSFSITLSATNAASTVTQPAAINVSCPTLTISPNVIANPVVGTPFSQTFSVSGMNNSAFTWSISGQPAGLSIVPTTGVLSGTATTAGAASMVVSAQGAAACSASTTINTTVNQAPSITSTGPATFVVGTNSSYSITAASTPAMTAITLTGCAPALPAGLAFSYVSGSTATLGGVATASGTSTCTVTASNGVNPAATQSLVVNANQAPTISAISISTFVVGTAGSGSFTVTGFPAPTLALSGCTLSSGLSLVGNQIAGTPNVGATSVSGCIVTASNGVLPTAATAAFTVTIMLPSPVVATSGGASAFTEDGPAVVVDGSVTVTQTGGPNLASGSVSITGGLVASEDLLAFSTQNGISGTYTSATGVLALTGSASIANYQTALRTITYNNTSQNPSAANRTVQFVVNDGSANSNLATKTVTVTGVNDAPVLATSAATLSYTENGAPAAINAVITVSDVDSTNLIGATVAITAGFVSGQDVLSYVPALGVTGSFNSGTGILTLSGTTTVANYQTALRNVLYSNLSNDPSNGSALTTSRTVSFQVNDGGAVNSASNTVTSMVTVTAVNNPPTATAISGLYAQAGIAISYPAGTLGGTDVEPGTTVSIVTTPDSVCTNCTLTINANGSFVFTPPPSAAATTANFTYHVTDNGRPGAGVAGTSATVSFNVAGPAIYFVKSAAAGAGNCNLGSECTVATALSNIGVIANRHIFVNDSNTHAPGAINLNAGGSLIGLGVTGTTFDALYGISTSGSGTLAARPTLGATRPTLSSAAATVTMNTGSAVRGLNIDVSAGANRGLVASGLSSGTLSVSDINVLSSSGTAVDISTSAGVTLNVTGSPNVVTSTTGKALSVVNTNLGATFRSISSNGAATGISLTSTSGSLTVSGDGAGLANGSGGSIANATTSALDALTAAGAITLKSMNVGLNTSASYGMLFDNNAGGTLAANLTGMNFTGVTGSGSQNKALLQFETGGGANVAPNVQNSFFNGSRTYGMFATAAGSSTLNVTLNQSGFGTNGNTGAAVNQPGSSIVNAPAIGLAITNIASSRVDYTVTNNTFWGADGLLGATYAVTISGTGSAVGSYLNGSFSGNRIGLTGVTGSGCSNNCAGLGLLPGIAGAFNPTVTNNDIRQTNSHGIQFANTVGASTFTSKLKIQANTVAEPDLTGAPSAQRAIFVTSGNSANATTPGSVNTTVCADIGDSTGANSAEKNSISGTWQAGNFVRVSNLNNSAAMVIAGLAGGSQTAAPVNAFIQARNTFGIGSLGADVNATVGAAGINGGGAPCP